MPYIGHSPTQAGSYIEVDDFGSSFNGSNVAFTLQVGGVNITPNQQNLLVMIDGVLQQPSNAFSVSGSTITFTEAPVSGADLYCLLMGQSASVGQGTIGADELKVSGDGSDGQVLKSDGDGTFTWLSQDDIAAGTLANARTINGVSFNGSANITVTADANTLSNTTLKSTVVSSSLTSVGTLTALTTGAITQNAGTFTIKNASSDSNGLKIYQDSGDASKIYNHYNGTLQLGVGSTTALTIDSSENSTFAGAIIQSMSNPYTKMIDTSSGGDDYGLNNNGSKFSIYNWTDGREELYFGGDGNATFAGAVTINTSASEQLMFKGATSPYLRFYESTTAKAYIQWHSDGYLNLENSEAGTNLAVGANGIGIGSTSPDSLIHAKVTTNTSENIKIQNDDSMTTMGVSSDGYSFHTYQHNWYWASWDGSTWSTKARLDSNGNFGLGTSSINSNAKMHIRGGDSGQTSSSNNTQLTVESSGTAGIQLLTGTTNVGGFWIGDSNGAESGGKLYYSNNTDFWQFYNSGSTDTLNISTSMVRLYNADSGSAGSTLKQLSMGWSTSTYWDTTDTGTFVGMSIANAHNDAGVGCGIQFVTRSSSSGISYIVSRGEGSDSSSLHFGTRGTDGVARRMLIGADGSVNISANSNNKASINIVGTGTGQAPNDAKVYVSKNSANDWSFIGTGGGDNYGMKLNGAGSYALFITDHNQSGDVRSRISFDGYVYSTDGSIHDIDSDKRKKEDIDSAESQWQMLKDLPLQKFKWKDKRAGDKYSYGWIAQDVQKKYPELVSIVPQTKEDIENEVEDPEYLTVRTGDIHRLAIKALQEAMDKIETLEAKVEALENA